MGKIIRPAVPGRSIECAELPSFLRLKFPAAHPSRGHDPEQQARHHRPIQDPDCEHHDGRRASANPHPVRRGFLRKSMTTHRSSPCVPPALGTEAVQVEDEPSMRGHWAPARMGCRVRPQPARAFRPPRRSRVLRRWNRTALLIRLRRHWRGRCPPRCGPARTTTVKHTGLKGLSPAIEHALAAASEQRQRRAATLPSYAPHRTILHRAGLRRSPSCAGPAPAGSRHQRRGRDRVRDRRRDVIRPSATDHRG